MLPVQTLTLDELIERRYVGLSRLAASVACAPTWAALAECVGDAFEETGVPKAVRLWAMTPDGLSELARYPTEHEFGHVSPRDLQRAAGVGDATDGPDGQTLIGLHADGVTLGVLEVDSGGEDRELLGHAAPVLACRFSLLAGQGVGGVLLAPRSLGDASDASAVMAAFASEAKRLLEHDRLSAYLLTPDGRAFERFAVATSRIIPGEGVLIPYDDVGLRHIVITNEPLVSSDLAADPRIIGREDRVIAQAGFHGLLSVPLRLDGRPFGVLNFVSRTPGFYREEDIPVAEQIADQIGVFVENLRVQRRMQAFVRQEATDRERARLSRDLFHAVAQAVPVISERADALREELAGENDRASEEAARIRDLAQLGLADVRRAVVDLDPRGLEAHTLDQIVEIALERLREEGGAEPRWQVEGDARGLSSAVERAVYRILQEAITNVRVHAQASTINVRLNVGRDLLLVVEDDGVGFEADRAAASDGLGLRYMRERGQAIGGFVTIDTAPGDGTSVRLVVPGVRDAVTTAPIEESTSGSAAGRTSLRVLVAAQSTVLRAGIIRLLEQADDLRVVGEAPTVEELRAEACQLRPDVVVLSIELEGDVVSLVSELRSHAPEPVVVFISDFDSELEDELLAAGASGLVRPSIEAAELHQAVRAVAEGARFVGAEVETESPSTSRKKLSPRERSILALVAGGQTNAQIGQSLFLATKTVERHVATIVGKLNARNRAHAAAIAVARRIVLPPPS